jgi:hypothetical protein
MKENLKIIKNKIKKLSEFELFEERKKIKKLQKNTKISRNGTQVGTPYMGNQWEINDRITQIEEHDPLEIIYELPDV